ncbi:MAG: glycosyltransferase family 2 protein [Patescibacteria group bacterium]
MKNKSTQLSLVFPIFNEAEVIPLLAKELIKFENKFPKNTEIIFVNDGSSDKSLEKLKKIKSRFEVKIVSFTRNFGHQSALLAGLKESSGELVVTLDADLQHPLSVVLEMIDLNKKGYEVVLTKRIDHKEISFLKKALSKTFYEVLNRLTDNKITKNGADFRLMSRNVVDALLLMPEKRKFLRGMIQWLGFKTIILPFKAEKRARGKSKYSYLKMFQLALHGLTSFSTKPLYLSGIFSLILFFFAFIYAVYVIYMKFWGTGVVSGWASVLFVVLVIGGFLSLFLGLLGVYVAAIYDETKRRPDFFIKSIDKVEKKR